MEYYGIKLKDPPEGYKYYEEYLKVLRTNEETRKTGTGAYIYYDGPVLVEDWDSPKFRDLDLTVLLKNDEKNENSDRQGPDK